MPTLAMPARPHELRCRIGTGQRGTCFVKDFGQACAPGPADTIRISHMTVAEANAMTHPMAGQGYGGASDDEDVAQGAEEDWVR